MKVIIANPPWKVEGRFGVRATSRWPHLRNDKIIVFPLYHAYAAAMLEKNKIEVKAIDAVDEELTINEFVKKVKEFSPDFVFLETSYPSYDVDKKTICELKKQTIAKIGIFGPDATARGEFLMKDCPEIDFAVMGEFDYTISEISMRKDLKKIKGICYRIKNKIKKTEKRQLIENLDELPLPARHLYPINSYQEPINYRPQFLISTSRGCPFGCSFCVYPQTISGICFRKRSVKNVVDEIEFLIKEYDAKVINIEDDTFTVDSKRVKEICDEILRRKIKILWQCYSSVNIQDFEMYKKMKEAGCEMVRFGVESASFAAQKHSNKNLSVEKIERGFALAKKAGLKTFGTFTFGLPGEAEESIKETIDLAIKLNPYAVQFSYIVAYPGTSLYEEAKKNNWLIKENQNGFGGCINPAILPDGLKIEELDGVVPRAYKKFYLRPEYILRQLIGIRNLQDIKRLSSGGISLLRRLEK